MRIFYQLPHKHYKFCKEVLIKAAPVHTPFPLELGKIRKYTNPDILRWDIRTSPKLFDLHELRVQFIPVMK